MSDILETIMLICFGISWPINTYKSYKARTAKGMSLTFLILILTGYICGIIAKLINPVYMSQISTKWYSLAVYIFNFCWVSLDLLVYFRNRRLDMAREN